MVDGNNVIPNGIFKPRHWINFFDYEQIISYIEIDENISSLHGIGRKTKINGKLVTKIIAFVILVVHLASIGTFPFLFSIGLKNNM